MTSIVTIEEAATALGTTAGGIRQRIKRGSIPAEAIVQAAKGAAIRLDLDVLLARGRPDVRSPALYGAGRIRPDGTGRPDAWSLDSYGVRLNGELLPRKRWSFRGSQADAEAELERRIAAFVKTPPKVPEYGSKAAFKRQRREYKPITTLKGPMTFRKYVDGIYLPWLEREKNLAISTIDLRRKTAVRQMYPVLGDMLLREVNTPAGVNKLRQWLQDQPKLKASYRNLVLATLKVILVAATRTLAQDAPLLQNVSYIQMFPRENVGTGSEHLGADGFRAGHLRDKRLSEAQVRDLWAYCDRQGEDAAYWRVWLGLGLLCGLRPGEAMARRWQDIDWATGRMLVNTIICPVTWQLAERTKGRKSAWVPLPPSLLSDLKELQAKTPDHPFILGGKNGGHWSGCWISQNMKRISSELWGKAKRVTSYHRLRHTFCSTLADRGIPVHVIQRMARHADITTTYGYIAPSTEAMQAAVDALDRR